MAGGHARVFFALVPPVPLRRTLGELARVVAQRAHGRPVPADNIHATLAFIGEWPVSALARLYAIGAQLDAAPSRVALDVVGSFRRAGVAWVGASVVPAEVLEVVGKLGDALSAIGVAQDERPFRLHLTLARKCRDAYPQQTIGPFAWDVGDVALMRSDTRAEGARYAILARW
ncbi:MAG TPA: RNA 2',3'-cyclic phosphodiesterase [Casimicrobiaceae bacterium]|nr:RNA 2',3'-cyclic phosphodiesterase [Casimicrobiaceae bacterium]